MTKGRAPRSAGVAGQDYLWPEAFTCDLLCRQQRQPAGDSEHAAARETNHDGALHPPGLRDPDGDPGKIPGGHQSCKECGLGAVGLNLGLKGGGNEWKYDLSY